MLACSLQCNLAVVVHSILRVAIWFMIMCCLDALALEEIVFPNASNEDPRAGSQPEESRFAGSVFPGCPCWWESFDLGFRVKGLRLWV
jgi:hypothetical protein